MVAISRKGLYEGNYTSWTKKWINKPTNDFYNAYNLDVFIDEKNDTLSVAYKDSSSKYRFAIYNISDFGAVYESPAGSHYTYAPPNSTSKEAAHLELSYFDYGGFSRSLQTYLLLGRRDEYTIEVWRGGTSALWSRNTRTDFGKTCYSYAGGISLLGKYVLVVIHEGVSPYDDYLMLYEGQ